MTSFYIRIIYLVIVYSCVRAKAVWRAVYKGEETFDIKINEANKRNAIQLHNADAH